MTEMTKIKQNFVLVVVLLLVGFTRFYRLGQVPTGLYWDETAMLMDARSVMETGKDIHGHGWQQALYLSYGDFKSPIYLWLATLSISLLGVNSLAFRLPSALIGIGSLFLLFYLLEQVLHSEDRVKSAIIVLLVLGLSPWSISFSRAGFEGHLGQFLLGLAVLLLIQVKTLSLRVMTIVKHLAKKTDFEIFNINLESQVIEIVFNLITLFIVQLVAALATYSYFSVRFVWPIIFVAALVIFPKLVIKFLLLNKQKLSRFLNFILTVMTGILFFYILLLPMFNSRFYQQSNRFRLGADSILNMRDWAIEQNLLRQETKNGLIARAFYHRYWLMLQELFKNYSDHLSLNFLFISGDHNLRHGSGHHGLFLLPTLPFLFLGVYFLAKRHWRWLMFLFIWWLAALLPATVPEDTPHALRSLNALLPVSTLIASGYLLTWHWLSKQTTKTFKTIFDIIAGGWLAISALGFVHYYFLVYPTQSAHVWQSGYKEIAIRACRQQDQREKIWVSTTDKLHYLWFLAFCDQVHTKSSHYHFDDKLQLAQLNNIYFQQPQWESFLHSSNSLLIISEYNLPKKVRSILSAQKFEQTQPKKGSPIFGQHTIPQQHTIYFFNSDKINKSPLFNTSFQSP
jgi:4-amino-4-deoxy-L-arabinose transferase-like glycosyltransferase